MWSSDGGKLTLFVLGSMKGDRRGRSLVGHHTTPESTIAPAIISGGGCQPSGGDAAMSC